MLYCTISNGRFNAISSVLGNCHLIFINTNYIREEMIQREQTDSRIMLKEQNGRFYIKEMQNGTDLETAWTRISKAEYRSMVDPESTQLRL